MYYSNFYFHKFSFFSFYFGNYLILQPNKYLATKYDLSFAANDFYVHDVTIINL